MKKNQNLNLNDRGNYDNNIFILRVNWSNIEIIKLLIDYTNENSENNIILEINNKNSFNDNPLLESISKNNIEMMKL